VSAAPTVELGLNAAIVAMRGGEPHILVLPGAGDGQDALPSGPFNPLEHRTLEMGLRGWVREQAGLELGYVEQLYTFGDLGRHASPSDSGPHLMSVGYLALAPFVPDAALKGAAWSPWYAYFPWEDLRDGAPQVLSRDIAPRLAAWAARPPSPEEAARPLSREGRVAWCFGQDGDGGAGWDEERVLDRYELLYGVGLVAESLRDGRETATQWRGAPRPGRAMAFDHRRILATAMGRLRGKLKYRPLVFELMPGEFTLTHLQSTVEAISGVQLHKQNFRRLAESAGLVEPTGDIAQQTGGRPARLYRFRREAVLERASAGLRVKAGRT
jgi:hypothetical protein